MNYNQLKADISAVVRANGAHEITGDALQQILKLIVDSLGGHYQFAGTASPDYDPEVSDERVVYIAFTEGDYPAFGGLHLDAGEVALLVHGAVWDKETLPLLTTQMLVPISEATEAALAAAQRANTAAGVSEQDHTRAEQDHSRAGGDHSRAEQDHTQAAGDHTQAATDHAQAGTDHSRAEQDHARAEQDHSTASGDHTTSTALIGELQNYDDKLTELSQEVGELEDNINITRDYNGDNIEILNNDNTINSKFDETGFKSIGLQLIDSDGNVTTDVAEIMKCMSSGKQDHPTEDIIVRSDNDEFIAKIDEDGIHSKSFILTDNDGNDIRLVAPLILDGNTVFWDGVPTIMLTFDKSPSSNDGKYIAEQFANYGLHCTFYTRFDPEMHKIEDYYNFVKMGHTLGYYTKQPKETYESGTFDQQYRQLLAGIDEFKNSGLVPIHASFTGGVVSPNHVNTKILNDYFNILTCRTTNWVGSWYPSIDNIKEMPSPTLGKNNWDVTITNILNNIKTSKLASCILTHGIIDLKEEGEWDDPTYNIDKSQFDATLLMLKQEHDAGNIRVVSVDEFYKLVMLPNLSTDAVAYLNENGKYTKYVRKNNIWTR